MSPGAVGTVGAISSFELWAGPPPSAKEHGAQRLVAAATERQAPSPKATQKGIFMRSLSERFELHGARGGGELRDAIEIGLISSSDRRVDRAVQLDIDWPFCA